MADTKITALAAIATVDPAADVLPIVDISDTSMAASGTTKKVTTNQILQAGGTATLASATITGDLTVDTSTLKVDSTNDRVGIGTASPLGKLHVVANSATPGEGNIQITNAAYPSSGWAFRIPDAAATIDLSLDGAIGGNFQSVLYFPRATGNVNISTGNLVMSTSGKGIDFSATADGSGTMTSELLNDYEEGTFTPGLTFGGASVGMTGTLFNGRYTKVGRTVTVNGIILLTAKGTSTGTALITGLPFTSSGSYFAVSLRLSAISFTDTFQGYIASSASTINLEQITNAGVDSVLTNTNFPVGQSVLIWNATYDV